MSMMGIQFDDKMAHVSISGVRREYEDDVFLMINTYSPHLHLDFCSNKRALALALGGALKIHVVPYVR